MTFEDSKKLSAGSEVWTIIPNFDSHSQYMSNSNMPCEPRKAVISEVAPNGNLMIKRIEHCGWQLPSSVFHTEEDAWKEFIEHFKTKRSEANDMISWAESHIS